MKTQPARNLACAALLLVACDKPKPAPPPDAGQAPPVVVRVRPPAAPGEVPVDIVKSQLSFSIVKDNDPETPVTGTLRLSDGAVSTEGGFARLTIDLDSFESGIHLRNDRVRAIFFESGHSGWDVAELTIAKFPEDVLAAVREKKRVNHAKLESRVKLHGHTATLALVVDAGYTEAGALWVKNSQPVAVKISDFELAGNLKQLSTTCGHQSIDDVIKIDVSLEFPRR